MFILLFAITFKILQGFNVNFSCLKKKKLLYHGYFKLYKVNTIVWAHSTQHQRLLAPGQSGFTYISFYTHWHVQSVTVQYKWVDLCNPFFLLWFFLWYDLVRIQFCYEQWALLISCPLFRGKQKPLKVSEQYRELGQGPGQAKVTAPTQTWPPSPEPGLGPLRRVWWEHSLHLVLPSLWAPLWPSVAPASPDTSSPGCIWLWPSQSQVVPGPPAPWEKGSGSRAWRKRPGRVWNSGPGTRRLKTQF